MKCPVTTDVGRAAEVLKHGGLVAFATETVYGLGAYALDERCVARIFEAKARPFFDPLIVHVADLEWLDRLTTCVSPTAMKLVESFWPGPLTLVLPKRDLVPDLVTSGMPTVAIRMPAHPQAQELLRLTDLPIAAPSANPFGQLSPTTAQHVLDGLGDRIDLILDGGPATIGVESTVVFVEDDRVSLLRHGGIPRERLEQVVALHDGPAPEQRQQPAELSPGMLPQHYAPRTPLMLATDDSWHRVIEQQRAGALLLEASPSADSFAAVEVLTADGNLTLAAANFFSALRRLDARQLDLIVAFPFPEVGLGRALNDRLRRAVHTR